ncbi:MULTISPECIES: hypothetical protein [unclassified Rathayibacter]|uniref:hypothetical protein n=1 Tax=unclassified Rathayibacter TaxID=2609250 RepID=UPI001889D6C4|nr:MULTISPECIES: hypothetical protein [unclassified Rathayibacter]MBF4461250.1 hypothetical protein [Rathayibacter sp. VKM Ac-2879]MBF4502661.1 hypothetical protein [Rathayibacter sp. VKM Ac-2878]
MIIDVVDTSSPVRKALSLALPCFSAQNAVRVAVSSWIDYSSSLAAFPDSTVFRAEMADHVPAALKTRALARLDIAPVVLLDSPSPAHEARLVRAGAAAVVTAQEGLAVLVERISDPPRSPPPPAPSVVELTDRELQVACLYCGRAAPSASTLATYLRLGEHTIRRHLARTRELFRAAGVDVPTRLSLRAALIEDGWLFARL